MAELVSAIRGEKIKPRGILSGSLNYVQMSLGATLIADPSSDWQRQWVDMLEDMKKIGHQSKRGPRGVQCEQGSPGMHFTFAAAAVVGVLLWALKRNQKRVIEACVEWLLNEIALEREFRFGERVIMPAPRVKKSIKQKPMDGYRDVFLKLALGEKVKKPPKYWDEPQSIAVATLREVLEIQPQLFDNGECAHVMPKLYLPIGRKRLSNGGFIAWLEDSPEARKGDVCDWVRCASDGVTWGYDFESEVPSE